MFLIYCKLQHHVRKEDSLLVYRRIVVTIQLSLLLLSGCAVPIVKSSREFVWPPPPNPPRIEWVQNYQSQLDLKKTPFRVFKESVTGEDAPVSLGKPVDVVSDSKNKIMYVSDVLAGAVYVYDLKNSELSTFSTSNIPNLTGSLQIASLALDVQSNLYALEQRVKKILVFDSNKQYLRTIDLPSGCDRPVSIAVDKQKNRLLVSDVQNSKIFVMDLNGSLLFSFGGPGDANSLFNRPVGLAVNKKSEILVADSFNARIQIFANDGTFIRAFGSRGDSDSDFQLMKSIAVDNDDNIYVVDARSNSIKIFDQTGSFLLSFGGYYALSPGGKTTPGGFALPLDIDIDDDNNVFVVDQLNARVQVFRYLPAK